MRVPMTSAGTRSEVNWMRWNWPPMAWASVLMAIVLASPGTPSTSRCPRASSATSMRSSSPSCPTIVFLTWYRVGSSGSRSGVGASALASITLSRSRLCRSLVCSRCGGYCCGPPAPPAAVAIGTAKPIPTKKFCRAGLARRGHHADHLPGPVEQRAAAVARVDRRVELDQPGQGRTAFGADGPVGGRHHARGEAALAGRAGCRRRRRRPRPAAGRPAPRARRPPAAGRR